MRKIMLCIGMLVMGVHAVSAQGAVNTLSGVEDAFLLESVSSESPRLVDVIFSHAVDPSTVSTKAFRVINVLTDTPLSIHSAELLDSNHIVLELSDALEFGMMYEVFARSSLQSLYGDVMSQSFADSVVLTYEGPEDMEIVFEETVLDEPMLEQSAEEVLYGSAEDTVDEVLETVLPVTTELSQSAETVSMKHSENLADSGPEHVLLFALLCAALYSFAPSIRVMFSRK